MAESVSEVDLKELQKEAEFDRPSFSRTSKPLEPPSIAKAEAHFLLPLSKALKQSKSGQEGSEVVVREYLATQANWAATLLLDLRKGAKADTYDKLKPAVLNSCGALAFINVTKGGLALSLASGYGFLIKKLSQDQYGNSAWGNPLFFTVSQAGFGLTAGYQHCQSVIAVLAEGSLEAFKNGTTSLGSDLGLFSTDGALTGMSGGVAMGDSQHMGMNVDNERSAFCYSKVDGVYLEVSAHRSAVTPDTESNTALYGAGFDPEAVLNDGRYKAELLPLYSMINHLGKVAVRGDEHVAGTS